MNVKSNVKAGGLHFNRRGSVRRSRANFRQILAMLAVWGTALAASEAASPAVVAITFDDQPPQRVDGMHHMGVSFGFQAKESEDTIAIYNSQAAGELSFVSGGALEGDTEGVLTLDFDESTSSLEFGVALLTPDDVSPGLTIELFDSTLKSHDMIALDTRSLEGFSQAMFAYQGSAVKRAVIDFNQNHASRFALDNLSFDAAPRSLPFVRGDTDGDGTVRVTDAIRVLHSLFLDTGTGFDCADAADADDSGMLDVTDAIFLLDFLFESGNPPPAPFPNAGRDSTQDALTCDGDDGGGDVRGSGGDFCWVCWCCSRFGCGCRPWLDR